MKERPTIPRPRTEEKKGGCAGVQVETQRAAALFHFLPSGPDQKHGGGGARGRQQSRHDFQALPRTGAAGSGKGVVCDCAGGQKLNLPTAGTLRKSAEINFDWTAIASFQWGCLVGGITIRGKAQMVTQRFKSFND